MFDKAIEKIQSEMNQNKNNNYIQVVGGFVLQHLQQDPGAAEKIMKEGKTIAGSLEEMRNQASKRQVTRCGMFTPQEGFEIVLKYFGINSEIAASIDPMQPMSHKIEVTNPEVKKKAEFNVSLDDLL